MTCDGLNKKWNNNRAQSRSPLYLRLCHLLNKLVRPYGHWHLNMITHANTIRLFFFDKNVWWSIVLLMLNPLPLRTACGMAEAGHICNYSSRDMKFDFIWQVWTPFFEQLHAISYIH